MQKANVREVEPGIFVLDHHFLGAPGLIASYLLPGPDGLTLVESGPGSTTETLLAGIRAAGFDPGDLRRILLTHIHLDHAGAAGGLVRRFPEARAYVHPAGAAHLVDPSRLLRSARRIYGDHMDTLWGEILPVPEDRLTVLTDGEAVRVGGRVLRALDTPGHASHHLAFHDPDAGVVFTGDVAGVRLERTPHVRPPTPPPDIDLGLWRASVARIRALRPRALLLTHFDAVDDPEWHLDDLLARLFSWAGWMDGRLEGGSGTEELVAALRRRGDAEIRDAGGDDDMVRRYDLSVSYEMIVDGLARYLRRAAEAREGRVGG